MVQDRYYVYLLVDPRKGDQPFYVGKGTRGRAQAHLGKDKYVAAENKRKSARIAEIRASGAEPDIHFWEGGLSESEAFETEIQLIRFYGREGIDPEGTLTNRGLDRRPPSALGRVLSEETKRKIGDPQRGELNHRFGTVMTDDEKALRRAYNLEHGIKPPVRSGPMSEEQKAAIGHGNRGKKRSEEICQKLSEQRRGRPRAAPTEETKEKIRLSNIAAAQTPKELARRAALKVDPRKQMDRANEIRRIKRAKAKAERLGLPYTGSQ